MPQFQATVQHLASFQGLHEENEAALLSLYLRKLALSQPQLYCSIKVHLFNP